MGHSTKVIDYKIKCMARGGLSTRMENDTKENFTKTGSRGTGSTLRRMEWFIMGTGKMDWSTAGGSKSGRTVLFMKGTSSQGLSKEKVNIYFRIRVITREIFITTKWKGKEFTSETMGSTMKGIGGTTKYTEKDGFIGRTGRSTVDSMSRIKNRATEC